MIDLSYYRIKEFNYAHIEMSEINEELLHQCAYYPKPAISVFGKWYTPCSKCSMLEPNSKCKHAHLLTLTESVMPLRTKKDNLIRKYMKELGLEDTEALLEFVRSKRCQK